MACPLPDMLHNELGDTVNDSLLLLHQGHEVEDIARLRSISPATVYNHLAQAIEAGVVALKDAVPLDEAQLAQIIRALDMFGNEENRLKPVYEALDQAYDYGVLKCVQASRIAATT